MHLLSSLDIGSEPKAHVRSGYQLVEYPKVRKIILLGFS